MTKPAVCAIILNWNNPADTLRCMESVYQTGYQPLEVVVVDNASRDNSVEQIRACYPQATVIQNAVNLGYAQGNNVGIEHALRQSVDYVLVLNDDAVVAEDMIEALVRAAEADPRAGILGPKVYTLEQPNVILSAGAYLERGSRIVTPALGQVDAGQWDQIEDVGYLSGCAVLVRRQAIEKVGMLDARFYLYQEDIDWCYRIRAGGYRCLYIPEARCWHPDTRTGRENSALVTYYMSRNHLLFVKIHKLGLGELLTSLAVFTRRILSWSLRPKWRYKRPQRDALVRAIIDFALGRYGKAEGFG